MATRTIGTELYWIPDDIEPVINDSIDHHDRIVALLSIATRELTAKEIKTELDHIKESFQKFCEFTVPTLAVIINLCMHSRTIRKIYGKGETHYYIKKD